MGIEKMISVQKVFSKSSFLWSMLPEKQCHTSGFHKKVFMKRPSVHPCLRTNLTVQQVFNLILCFHKVKQRHVCIHHICTIALCTFLRGSDSYITVFYSDLLCLQ